jgi:short-subunit dehydrogenase
MKGYGPWAVIAGASEGIGAAFAKALEAQGINLVLVARRAEPLHELAENLKVETREVTADLSTHDGLEKVFTATKDLEVGLVVANAALSPIGPFTEADPAELERALDLNCRAPMLLAHHYLPAMLERRRGGLIIMSSLAGQQGSPGLSLYAGTKAFGMIFAEGLWAEARERGVDVVACVAGAVSTPGLIGNSKSRAPGTLAPEVVAAQALAALGRKPRMVPGALMRFSSQLMTRLMPRKAAINMIAKASKKTLA